MYLCTFGMEDELRAEVAESVGMLRFGQKESADSGQVTVRILSGDHIDTAKYVGLQAGVVSEDQLEL